MIQQPGMDKQIFAELIADQLTSSQMDNMLCYASAKSRL